jgi:hypothetical protein
MAAEPILAVPEDAGHRQRMIHLLRYVIECNDAGIEAQLPVEAAEGIDLRNVTAVDDLIAEGFLRAFGSESKVFGGGYARLEEIRATEAGRSWLRDVSNQVVWPPTLSSAQAVEILVSDGPVELSADQQRRIEAVASAVQSFLETDPDLAENHLDAILTPLRVVQSAGRAANDVGIQTRALKLLKTALELAGAIAGAVTMELIASRLSPLVDAAIAVLI